MRSKRFFLATFVLLVSLNFPAPAEGVNDESSRATLRGLKGFEVFVEKVAPSIENGGLTSEDLLEVALQELTIAGIPVTSEAGSTEGLRKEGSPYLSVIPIIMKTKFCHNYFYTIDIEFYQLSALVRDPSVRVHTCTWSESLEGISPDLELIKTHLASLLEVFVNAYFSVNPR